jgi:hypothetical protein
MIYEYNNVRREHDIILLLKVRRKSKNRSKKHLLHFNSFSARIKKKQSVASLHFRDYPT